MSWTEDQLDRLRAKMAEAERQGARISAAEAGLIASLIHTMRRLTMSKGWSGVPNGPLPTIGDSRREGITAFEVYCDKPHYGGVGGSPLRTHRLANPLKPM